MSPFRLAWINLTRRKVPTVIAILAISISVACSGILLRLNQLSEDRFSNFGNGGDAIVGAKAGGIDIILGALNGETEHPGYLPYKLFESLRAEQAIPFEDGVVAKPSFIQSIIPFVYFAKYFNYRVVGTDESFLNRPVKNDSLEFSEGQWAAGADEVVLGYQVAEKQNVKVGDTIQTLSDAPDTAVINLPLKVTGILKPTSSAWDRMLFANVKTAQQSLAKLDLSKNSIWGAQVLNYFLIYLKPGGFAPLSALVNRRTVGQAVVISEQKERLKNLTGTGEQLGFFVTILILILGGLSVAAMLITRFDAMALQLAVLRALGYKKKTIGQWLLWEGFLLGLAACFVGLVLDLIGFPLIRNLLGEALPSAELVSSSILQSAPIWITALLATTASVFIPLYRVYHQDVHFSLRN